MCFRRVATPFSRHVPADDGTKASTTCYPAKRSTSSYLHTASSHAALIRQALEADLHVLCEKPLVTQLADAQLVARFRARWTGCVCSSQLAQSADLPEDSALIAEGAIGGVRSIRWRTLRTQPRSLSPRRQHKLASRSAIAGGGILLDHGWHALYCIVRWPVLPAVSPQCSKSAGFTNHRWKDTATLRSI